MKALIDDILQDDSYFPANLVSDSIKTSQSMYSKIEAYVQSEQFEKQLQIIQEVTYRLLEIAYLIVMATINSIDQHVKSLEKAETVEEQVVEPIPQECCEPELQINTVENVPTIEEDVMAGQSYSLRDFFPNIEEEGGKYPAKPGKTKPRQRRGKGHPTT